MKNISFILLLVFVTIVTVSCQPPKQGGYENPARGNEGSIEEDVVVQIDSSVEKAIQGDTTKRDYHL